MLYAVCTLAVIPCIEAGLPGTISRISPGAVAVDAAALEEDAADEADMAAALTLGTMALRIMPRG